jgi:carbamate kinase
VSVAPAVIDEDFIAEVLAEEVTAKSRSENTN